MALCHPFRMKKFIFVFAALLMSCAHQKTVSEKSSKTVAKKTRTARQSPSSSAARANSDFKKDQAMVLAAKRKNGVSSAGLVSANPQNKRLELKPDALSKKSEATLLAEIQDRYDMNDEAGFNARYKALQAKFPKSARLNEVRYMAGLLAISNKNYGPALQAFDTILKTAPRSHEAPKAMFAKAITYKRMNLPEPSRQLLRTVQTRYPKSLEAQRASLELKIEEQRTR